MFCKQCGQAVSDGVKFCPACGTPVAAEQAVAEATVPVAQEPPVTVAEPVAQPVKKSKKGLVSALVAVAAVVALVAVAVLTPIKNVFIGLMPAEKHMQYVYADAAKDFSEDVGEAYGVVVEKPDASNAASGTIELRISSALMSRLESAMDVDLGSFNKIAIDYAVAVDTETEVGYTLMLKLQDKELLTLKLYLDAESGEMVMDIPGVLKKPVKTEAIDPSQLATVKANSFAEMKTDALPDETFVRDLIPQLIRVAFEQVTDVERSKEVFEAGDVEQKATCFEAEITTQTVAEMADAVLEELKDNKTLKKAIIGFCDDNAELLGVTDGEEVYDAFTDTLKEGQDELEDVEDDTELFTLKTWVDRRSDIIALEVEADDVEFFIGKATDGDKIGYEISATSGSKRMLYIVGEGTEKKHILDAAFTVEVEGDEYVKLAVEGYDLKQAEKGYLNGVFTLTPGDTLTEMESMLSGAALKITSTMSEDNGAFVIDVQLQGVSLGSLRLTAGADKEADVTIPDNAVAMDELTADMVDVQALLDKLEAAGLTEDMINSLTAMFMGGSADAYADSAYGGEYL